MGWGDNSLIYYCNPHPTQKTIRQKSSIMNSRCPPLFCWRLSFLAVLFLFLLNSSQNALAQARPVPSVSIAPGKDKSPECSSDLFDQAKSAMKAGDWRKAADLFGKFKSANLNDSRKGMAMYYRGLCQAKSGRDREAFITWTDLWRWEMLSEPKSEAMLLALEQMALHFEAKGQQSAKHEAMRDMLKHFPGHPITTKIHASEAAKYFESGDYQNACNLYMSVGEHLDEEHKQRWETARELLAPASLGKEGMDALLDHANAMLERNNVEAAIKLYRQFLARHGTSLRAPEAKNRLGWCLYLKGSGKDDGKKLLSQAERLWEETLKTGGEWCARSRWNLIVLNAGHYENIPKACSLCEEQCFI